MIEIGRKYTLVTIECTDSGYDKGSISVTVTGRDGNLIEVNGCEVINLTSPMFHSLVDAERQKEYFNALAAKLID